MSMGVSRNVRLAGPILGSRDTDIGQVSRRGIHEDPNRITVILYSPTIRIKLGTIKRPR